MVVSWWFSLTLRRSFRIIIFWKEKRNVPLVYSTFSLCWSIFLPYFVKLDANLNTWSFFLSFYFIFVSCLFNFLKIGSVSKLMNNQYPSAKLYMVQHWPSIAKNLPKIGCQYRAVAGMITPVCTWGPMLAQTLAVSTCFRHSNGPMLCRTLVFSLSKWFAAIKVTHGLVMCCPWARLRLF